MSSAKLRDDAVIRDVLFSFRTGCMFMDEVDVKEPEMMRKLERSA